MKLFDVDWSVVLRDLSRWSMMSVPARALLVSTLKLTGYTTAAQFGVHLDEIVASGIPTYDPERKRLILDEPHRDLLKVLRAMSRHSLFDDPAIPALHRYLDEHFSHEEVKCLCGNPSRTAYANVTKHALATRVTSAGWPGDLLDANTDARLLAWAAARGQHATDAGALATLRGLQVLVQSLVALPDAVSLSVWYAALPPREREPFARIVHLGLRTVVLFAAMREQDLEPLLGVWPLAAFELRRPPATAPVAVTPEQQFGAALFMEDMAALLATVVSAPVRLRANDLAVFARTRTEVESRLVPVPTWAEPLFVRPDQLRVDRAGRFLRWYEFVTVESRHGNPHLVSTDAGAAWLARSSHDRLQSLLDPMRTSKSRNPRPMYGEPDATDFFSFTLPYFGEPKGLQLRVAITTLFLALGDDFYSVDTFLDFAARGSNPFLSMSRDALDTMQAEMHIGHDDPRDAFRSLWQNAVLEFLRARLTVFGCATLGVQANGEVCFAITDIGRYLFGATNAFTYGEAGSADMVVQPNFDIVFLGASPSLEAAVARAAERVGVAPGLAFRLTRASVIRAAESGITAEEILSMLTTASSKPVPQNVQREVAGWMASVRRARLRAIEVIDAGDEETAHRVMALLGSKATRLNSTYIELLPTTGSSRAALIKKLKAGGVLLDDETGRVKHAPRGRPRLVHRWDEEE